MLQENLQQRLLVLRDTLRRAVTFDGIGRAVLATVICLLSAIVLDYFFFRRDYPINTFFRVIMLAGIVGLVGTIVYRRLIAPRNIKLSVEDMALAVEKEFPQLNDSLISTVQLTRIMADDRAVSGAMVDEVARKAHQEASAVDFLKVVKFERVKPVLIAAGSALALFLLLCALPVVGEFARTGVVRVLNPFSRAAYPVRTDIVVTMGDANAREGDEKKVPRNDSVTIVAQTSGSLPSRAEIRFSYNNKGFGNWEPITTARTRIDDKSSDRTKEFEYVYNPVISSFQFEVRAGDNQKGPYDVKAVDRPELNNMFVTYELPSYIQAGPPEKKRERSLRNVIGSKAKLEGELNKPLKEANLKVGNDAPFAMALSPDKKRFAAQITLDESKDYEITLLDEDDLDNKQSKIRHKIFVLPDALPRVTWRTPAMDLEVSPAATVALALSLDDDYGLQKSGIKFKRFKGVGMVAPAAGAADKAADAPPAAPAVALNSPAIEGGFDLPEPTPGAFNRSALKVDINKDWALAEMGLEPGDLVEYWAEAYDWCPTIRKGGEPQIFRLRVLSLEEMRKRLDIERLRLIEDLKVIIRDQEADKKSVDTIKDHLALGNPFEQNERAKVSEAGALQEEVRRKTQHLQSAFDSLIARYVANGLDTPDDRDRLQQIRDVLETEHSKKMPEASRSISSSAMTKQDNERITKLTEASKQQEEIINNLKALLDQMQKWAETEELLRMTRALLLKQRGVTALTEEFKKRLGSKEVSGASKEELGQVKGLEHEERDCVTDMQNLFVRMTQAMAKMQQLDKFAYKNIEDSIKIAQNTDATPDNPDLATTGDTQPSIEDKMRGAQNDIQKFGFGIAGGKQRAAEQGLQRIITVLMRRRDVDKQLMKDIEAARKNLEKVRDEQRNITRKIENIMDKKQLEASIKEARSQVEQIQKQQQRLLDDTQKMSGDGDPKAAGFEKDLEAAKKGLETLIKDQEGVFKQSVATLSPAEQEITRILHALEAIETEERALQKESADLAASKIDTALRTHYDKVRLMRMQQDDLLKKAKTDEKSPDKLKAQKDAQSKLVDAAEEFLKGVKPAPDDLLKDVPKDSPQMPALQLAVRALQQAASFALHVPADMKSAATQLGDGKGKEALIAELDSLNKLANTEEVLLKALGFEQKRFEDAMNDVANRQADTRGKLDEVSDAVANLIRAGNTPEQTAKDPKLAAAGKVCTLAAPELETSSREMAEGADMIRQASPKGDKAGAGKGAALQLSSAEHIAKARAILQGASEDLAKDKKTEHGKNGESQGQTQTKATALSDQIKKLSEDIEAAHSAASGSPAQAGDPSGASKKVAEAASQMADAKKDLAKPNPAGAIKSESKALDALEDARAKLNDLQKKIDELKSPSRRLERLQGDVKKLTREISDKVEKIETQMAPDKEKAADKLKNAGNNMQNAENSLGASGKPGEGQDGKDGQSGKSGDGKSGDGKSGDGKSSDDKKGGDKPGEKKGGDKSETGEKEDAVKEQKQALSELEKALAALDDLSKRAEKEPDPRTKPVLEQMKPAQLALREELEKLRKKMDQFSDKTGNPKAQKAKDSAGSASKNQSASAGQMGQGSQGGSKSSSEEAEKDLEEALDNLQQFEQQMRQQSRNEELFQIEQELKKMLGVEKDLSVKTIDIDKRRPAPPAALPRALKGGIQQIFRDQLALADSTKAIVKRLEDSPVFQWVLQTSQNDMNEAAARLDKEDSASVTQEIQQEVIRNLGDLIEALRKERQNPQQGGQGQGQGGGGGKQPLVPPLAELKMLRIMQRYVNNSTKKVDDEVSAIKKENKDLSRDQRDRLRRAGVKEGEIWRMTKKMADDLKAGGAQQGGPPPVPDGEPAP